MLLQQNCCVWLSSCACVPTGYEFFDDGFSRSEEDSTKDCQPIIYDRCTGKTSRDLNGNCVDLDGDDCPAKCG